MKSIFDDQQFFYDDGQHQPIQQTGATDAEIMFYWSKTAG